jgi:NAD(P)-dependent dehydrogenase (short-subunit alcohol dehydrogenase family)
MVRTPMLDSSVVTKEDYERDEALYPLGYGEPEDVAHAAVFLLSDASRWITGTALVLDGGRLL